jgi:mannan endo-1,4-beta-mannosidase
LSLLAALLLVAPAFTQTPLVYDDFSAATLNPALWTVINEAGTDLADVSTADGVLTVTGKANRTGAATTMRPGRKCVVEVTALGWTGTNQILQFYAGSGTDFTNFLEFGLENTEPDGTPIAHIWTPTAETYSAPSPVKGRVSPANPSVLRVERDNATWRFFINGNHIHTYTGEPVPDDGRIVLYGWRTSVSIWDDIRMTGPSVKIISPVDGTAATNEIDITGETGHDTASWKLEAGLGEKPLTWHEISSGTGTASGILGHYRVPITSQSKVTLRLTATDAEGFSRSARSTLSLTSPGFRQPLHGQVVGTAFSAVLCRESEEHVRAVFFKNGQVVGETNQKPFTWRIITEPGDDGPCTLGAILYTSAGVATVVPEISVTIQRDLFGSNPRVADDGKGFVFPDGSVGIAVGQNDGYPWAGLDRLWQYGDVASAENYVKNLRAHGVNVMRIMVEYAQSTSQLLENPLGSYRSSVVNFWDRFLPICERNGMTVLMTPWDTFWMNQPWSANPYNAVNGGPCETVRDFITKPEARAWQKARFKFIIDRWGASKAIFAIDLLNEFDIWWDASTEERADWIEEMAAYVESYERQKWGRRHMLTVSSAAAQPGGIIGEIIYRHPLFDFANTHQYYGGTVNNPQNIIDPAISVNGGIKYSLPQCYDGRPYTDSESGPIDNWIQDESWDNLYFRFMAWAHFASGGTGTGMRWPYRTPHYLTAGMHDAQLAVSSVSKALDWLRFNPVNADSRLSINKTGMILMGCADSRQGVAWIAQDVRVAPAQNINGAQLTLTDFEDGRYIVTCWNPVTGSVQTRTQRQPYAGNLIVPLPTIPLDVAVTVRRIPDGDLNIDMVVDMSDAAAALKIAGGLSGADSAQTVIADMNGDGLIDLRDAVAIALLVK